MTLLLDTNILIYAYRNQGQCRSRLDSQPPGEVSISAVTAMEIEVGLTKSERPEAMRRFWTDALGRYRLLALDLEAARHAGRLRAQLEAAGTPIGPYDTQIAGIALAHNLTLVTRNVREFARIPGLRLENWFD